MTLEPFVSDSDFTLYVGDVRDVLAGLPDGSVDCVVTSPPYWGLRDYGSEGQIGLEPTPEAYVEQMVAVFRHVKRVMADHATLWLNLGDAFSEKQMQGAPWRVAFALQADGWYLRSDIIWAKPNPMPESVRDRPTKAHEYVFLLSKQPRYFFDAEAVREEYAGEFLSSGARNARFKHGGVLPNERAGLESEQPRAGKGTYTFGARRALYDLPSGQDTLHGKNELTGDRRKEGFNARWDASEENGSTSAGRNVRSVWSIATQPYPEAHFATFPEALAERCIKAGCPEWVCGTCGKPRERMADVTYEQAASGTTGRSRDLREPDGRTNGTGFTGKPKMRKNVETLGWSDCGHDNYRPGRVLDPFMGSGTVALVARNQRRHSIGVELNEEYALLCAKRLQQLSLLAEGTM